MAGTTSRWRRRRVAVAAAVLAVVIAGCGGADDGPLDTDGTTTDDAATDDAATEDDPTTEDAVPPEEIDPDTGDDAEPGDGGAAAGSDPLLGPEVEAILAELESEGVDLDDVLITTTELVTWPDGSLGCPDPDMMYTQALVEGYRIVVEVDGEERSYHGANGDDPFRCEDPQPPIDGS